MKTFVTEIDALKDLKNAMERYSSNGTEFLWGIESVIQSRLNEFKNQESRFTSKIQEAEDSLSSAERALRACEAQTSNDDENGKEQEPDCSEYESEVYDCRRQLEEAQQKFDTYKQEIWKLESDIDYYQNAKIRIQSSLEYLKDTASTRLLLIINKLEEYISYTLLPSYNSDRISTTSSATNNNKVNYIYKEFHDNKVAYDWGYSEHSWGKLWTERLSKEQKESLNRYKQYDYIGINDYLRYGEYSMAANGSQFFFHRIKEDIDKIDSALNLSIIPENIVAYRGFVDFECKTGEVIAQKAYESTSLSYNTALHYANKATNLGKKSVVAKIYIAKGKRGAFMEGISNIKEDGNEILLPRKTKYKVLSIKYVNGIKHIDLEVL